MAEESKRRAWGEEEKTGGRRERVEGLSPSLH